MKIGFFGTPQLSAQVLQDCLDAPDMEVVYVVTQPDRPVWRHAILTPSPVATIAMQKNIPLYRPASLKKEPDILLELQKYEVDFLVVVAYGNILPKAFLELPRILPVNIHGSILPRYRGASPIQSALLEGETTTGVTIMQMSEGMDEGDILLIETIPIAADETSDSLFRKFEKISGSVLLKALRMYQQGLLKRIPQDHSQATFTKKFEKDDGKIDWSKITADEAYRRWQAFTSWPGIWSTYHGKRCKILRCSLGPSCYEIAPGTVMRNDCGVFVGCRDGCIQLDEVILEGKARQFASTLFRNADRFWES